MNNSFKHEIGPPPGHFYGEHLECWFELKRLVPKGCLQRSDCIMFELLVVLLTEYRGIQSHNNLIEKVVDNVEISPNMRSQFESDFLPGLSTTGAATLGTILSKFGLMLVMGSTQLARFSSEVKLIDLNKV